MTCLRCHRRRGPPLVPCAVCEMLSAPLSAQKPDPSHPSLLWSVGQTGRAGKPDQHRSQRQSTEPLALADLGKEANYDQTSLNICWHNTENSQLSAKN